jgi:hypothetical protein
MREEPLGIGFLLLVFLLFLVDNWLRPTSPMHPGDDGWAFVALASVSVLDVVGTGEARITVHVIGITGDPHSTTPFTGELTVIPYWTGDIKDRTVEYH